MGKQVEGDNEQRRARARDAREEGRSPSAEGVTTGASKQRSHRDGGDTHTEKMDALRRGKQDPDHVGPDPRPGSTD